MTKAGRGDWWIWGAMLLTGLVYLPRLFLADSALGSMLFTPYLAVAASALFKLGFLLLATYYAARCSHFFEAGNPVRPAWLLLAWGFGLYAVAQAVLAVYQIVLAIPTPFPSWADPFFVLSMLVLIASLILFVVAYRGAGYPVAGPAELGAAVVGGLLLLAAVGLGVLRPLAQASAPWLATALNYAYPILDGILVVPAILLLRMAAQLRGGSLWKVWMLLLLGFLVLAAGDILFAYFTTLDLHALDPVIDLAYGVAYVLFAWGAREQYGISK